MATRNQLTQENVGLNGNVEDFRIGGKTLILLHLWFTPHKSYRLLGIKKYKYGTLADIERSITGRTGRVRECRAVFESMMRNPYYYGLFKQNSECATQYCVDEEVLLDLYNKLKVFTLIAGINTELVKRRNVLIGEDM